MTMTSDVATDNLFDLHMFQAVIEERHARIQAEMARLERILAELKVVNAVAPREGAAIQDQPVKPKQPTLSAEARARISAAQKKRWAIIHKATKKAATKGKEAVV